MPLSLPDELRAVLGELRLHSRAPIATGGLGMHASRNRGAGLEFAQYRGYQPGDEPRHIDWKLFARSDRYFVREAEFDSQLTVWIVIDASASMGQADQARSALRKLDAAKLLALAVMELALRQGDLFGLVVLANDSVDFIAAAAGPRQRDRCLLALDRMQPAGNLPGAEALRPLWEKIQAGSLVVMFSDGFDDGWTELSCRLASARREVRCTHLSSAEERDFPFKGGLHFRDPESGVEIQVDAARARAGFLERFGKAREALRKRLQAAGIAQVEHVLDRPLVEPLRYLFGGPRSRDDVR